MGPDQDFAGVLAAAVQYDAAHGTNYAQQAVAAMQNGSPLPIVPGGVQAMSAFDLMRAAPGAQVADSRRPPAPVTPLEQAVAVAEHAWRTGQTVEQLDPRAAALLQGIRDNFGVDLIGPNSGYARGGHVGSSQHYHGNAIDLNVSGRSEAEKAAILEWAIANGARGVGIYPSGNSLHLDVRGTPMAWGWLPGDKYGGFGTAAERGISREQFLAMAPAWAQPHLMTLVNAQAAEATPARQSRGFLADIMPRAGEVNRAMAGMAAAGQWRRDPLGTLFGVGQKIGRSMMGQGNQLMRAYQPVVQAGRGVLAQGGNALAALMGGEPGGGAPTVGYGPDPTNVAATGYSGQGPTPYDYAPPQEYGFTTATRM